MIANGVCSPALYIEALGVGEPLASRENSRRRYIEALCVLISMRNHPCHWCVGGDWSIDLFGCKVQIRFV